MKAILVIDIDANELPKDAYANIYVFGKYYEEQEDDFVACIGDVPLKPMPKKINREVTSLIDYVSSSNQYVCGYNDCIDEILGETK